MATAATEDAADRAITINRVGMVNETTPTGAEGARGVADALRSQPRFPLATLPTPLQEAPRLRAALGGPDRCPRILIKRDDLTGLALGGNKARKLEFLVADAVRAGATVLVTTGGAQSNHARMTAAAARIAGMRAVLVLEAAGPRPPVQGNLLLDRILGAEVHIIETPGSAPNATSAPDATPAAAPSAAPNPAAAPASAADPVAARIDEVMASLRARGERPYLVPLGGSTPIGTLGYVDAMRELVEQLRAAGESPRWLYHASGSRGTQAGLALGAHLFDAPCEIQGIAVSPGEPEKTDRALGLIREAGRLLGREIELPRDRLRTDESYYGAGYAIPTPAGLEAIELLARTEAVLLDPVYTGKAMAGLIDHCRRGLLDPDDTVVFLHTGGAPALFAQAQLFAPDRDSATAP